MNKFYSILTLIGLFIFLLSAGICHADSHDDYTPIYKWGFDVKYKDASGETHTETRDNFRDLFNPNDPKVLCNREFGPCEMPDTLRLPTMDANFSYHQFRIYVPTGSTSLELKFFTAQGDVIALACRYGQPVGDSIDLVINGFQVTKTYNSLTLIDYNENIDFLRYSQFFRLDDYTNEVCLKRTAGGWIPIMGGGLGRTLTEGGWFYFKVITFQAWTRLYGISGHSDVDTDVYIPWYNSVEWLVNGDPGEVKKPDGFIGLYDDDTGTFYEKENFTPGPADIVFDLNVPDCGWLPIAGDWNGDGQTTVGLFNQSTGTFYLRNTNSGGIADVVFRFGPKAAGWLPIAGDWDKDGKDTIGLYDPCEGVFYLKNSLAGGIADVTFRYGPKQSEWLPVIGE